MTDHLLNSLFRAEEIFYTSGLPLEDYLLACDQLRSTIQEMSANTFSYARAIEGSRSRLESNAFYFRGHDPALIELIRTMPFSISLVLKTFGQDDDSKIMISALVESFCRQSLVLTDISDDDFNRILHRLVEIKMPKECIMMLEHLIERNDGRHDKLAGSIIYSMAATTAFSPVEYSEIRDWLAEKGAAIMAKPWSKHICESANLRACIAIYKLGMTDIGAAGMMASAASAKSGELIIREQLIGQTVTKEEASRENGHYPQISALLPYALWHDNKSFKMEWLYGSKIDSKTLTAALDVAGKDKPVSTERYHEAISIALNSSSNISDFFAVIRDHAMTATDLSPGIIQQGLMVLLNHHKHEYLALKNIAKQCDEFSIELDVRLYQDIIDVTFIEAIRDTSHIGVFLCELKKPICKIISPDILLEKVTEVTDKLSETLLQKVASVIYPDLVEKIPALHRAKLSNDLGI